MKVVILCICAILFAACSSNTETEHGFASLPAGDAVRGAALFAVSVNGAPACSTCHTLDGAASVGPSFQDYAAHAPVEAAGAESLEAYIYASIVQPSAYIVSGFGNSMYNQYQRQLSPQEIADLIAYLLTV